MPPTGPRGGTSPGRSGPAQGRRGAFSPPPRGRGGCRVHGKPRPYRRARRPRRARTGRRGAEAVSYLALCQTVLRCLIPWAARVCIVPGVAASRYHPYGVELGCADGVADSVGDSVTVGDGLPATVGVGLTGAPLSVCRAAPPVPDVAVFARERRPAWAARPCGRPPAISVAGPPAAGDPSGPAAVRFAW